MLTLFGKRREKHKTKQNNYLAETGSKAARKLKSAEL